MSGSGRLKEIGISLLGKAFFIDLKNRFTMPDATNTWADELDFFKKTLDEVQHHLSEMQALTSAYLSNLSKLKSQEKSNPISQLTVDANKSQHALTDCSDGVVPHINVSDDDQIQLVTKDTTQVINTVEQFDDVSNELATTVKLLEPHLEDGTVLNEDYVASSQPIILTEVPYSHHPIISLHDDVELVNHMGCVEYENVVSSILLDASFFCTSGVCENVYETFLYPKMIYHWFQRQNIHMVVNEVSFLLDWVEKPPPFPPDITHDAIIYKALQASGEENHDLNF